MRCIPCHPILHALGLVFAKEGLRRAADGAKTLLVAFLHENRDNEHNGQENENDIDDDRHGNSSSN